MKSIVIIALALVAVVAAIPVAEPPKIVRQVFDQNPDGSFHYIFETENGIFNEQFGEIKQAVDEDNKPRNVIVLRGTSTYINDNGAPETITYVADEAGYRAEGESIPKAPAARR